MSSKVSYYMYVTFTQNFPDKVFLWPLFSEIAMAMNKLSNYAVIIQTEN